ncbi:MAG: hypothetical protein HC836_05030 [Richelia sp. RM2_1_2]|nr:hypothetical protein [Richelia sp. SM2_1_7]NJN09930.1 hypothetical protein [Richelia sp. RM1_1_1]NJO26599.1 hypothetical protein [Richelia sp. SL_2_1]NJO57742.1 hypothetical protein [Richelia sp. RM2_1_2]
MDFEREVPIEKTTEELELETLDSPRKPFKILRNAEAFLRRPTVAAIVPILPPKLSENLQDANDIAEDSLEELAEIDLNQINDWELRPFRMRIGLSFVGFSSLAILVLALFLTTLHPQMSPTEQIARYWGEYIWFVCLGVTGMFLLGREAMRPINKRNLDDDW